MLLLALVAAAAAAALAVSPVVLPRAAPRPRAPATVPVPQLAGLGAALAVLLLAPPSVALPLALVAGIVSARSVGRLEPASARRRRRAVETALPHVVDLISSCLAAGHAPSGALQRVAAVVVGPMAEELTLFARRLALGAEPLLVWRDLARHPQLGPLGRALVRAAESGAPVSESLARLGSELRAARQAEAQARARTVEVKAALPLGLCLLPAFVLTGVVPMVAGSFSLTFLGS